MDSNELQRLMQSEGLNTTAESHSYDRETGVFGFGYSIELFPVKGYPDIAVSHSIWFDDIKEFEAMTIGEVIAKVSRVRYELLFKIRLHKCFKQFCKIPDHEQVKVYTSFLAWYDKNQP